jgi:hypothetical protein
MRTPIIPTGCTCGGAFANPAACPVHAGKPGKVRAWEAPDRHTGVSPGVGAGLVPFTYRHVARVPSMGAEVYRIETYTETCTRQGAVHVNVHYVPAAKLEWFLEGRHQHPETLLDIRPLTRAEADAELDAFRMTEEGSRRVN